METTLVKKYSNRRLYDTSSSSYIVQVDLIAMIKEGNRIKVVDAQTNRDITASTLLHALAEYNLNQIAEANDNFVGASCGAGRFEDTQGQWSELLQELMRVCLNLPHNSYVGYLKVISDYMESISNVYKTYRDGHTNPLNAFIALQKIQVQNAILLQSLLEIAQRHFY